MVPDITIGPINDDEMEGVAYDITEGMYLLNISYK